MPYVQMLCSWGVCCWVRFCDGLGSNVMVPCWVHYHPSWPDIAREYMDRLSNHVHPMNLTLQRDSFQKQQFQIHTVGTVQSWCEEHAGEGELQHLPLASTIITFEHNCTTLVSFGDYIVKQMPTSNISTPTSRCSWGKMVYNSAIDF
jgi:hypothetical protein